MSLPTTITTDKIAPTAEHLVLQRNIRRISKTKLLEATTNQNLKQIAFKNTITQILIEASTMLTELKDLIITLHQELQVVREKLRGSQWINDGSVSLAKVSRRELLTYKAEFTTEQWEGMMGTCQIVESRARLTESTELTPLTAKLKLSKSRRDSAMLLTKTATDFLRCFKSYDYNNTVDVMTAADVFVDRFVELDADTSGRGSKFEVLDECVVIKLMDDLMYNNSGKKQKDKGEKEEGGELNIEGEGEDEGQGDDDDCGGKEENTPTAVTNQSNE